jgi:Ala-tRNA(Pro) deacylase
MYDAKTLVNYLTERGIAFEVEKHPKTYTAMETAAAEAVSGKRFAKSVVVMAGGKPVLAVLPAHLKVDLEKLSRISGKSTLRLAKESEFETLFPNCEVGAMPPFGRLYSMPVYIDDDIAVAPEVTFNACSHEHTITMSGKNFLKAAEAVVGDFTKD